MKKNSKAGFTLIELLVVIAIIGVRASIAMGSLAESRVKSLNASRAAQIKEYQKALELYYADNGVYPTFGAGATAIMCLGDYPDDRCWANGTGSFERVQFVSALTPTYIPRIHEGETILFGAGGTTVYEGMIYTHLNFGRSYSIQYFMQGNNRNCLIGSAVATNMGSDTHCIYTSQ